MPEAADALSYVTLFAKNHTFSKRACPVCCKRMRLAYSGGGTSELDTCDRCKLAWFDNGEYALGARRSRFGSAPPPKPSEPATVIRHSRGVTAAAEAPLLDVVDTDLDQLINIMTGLPREENGPEVRARLLTLPLLFMLCIGLSIGGERAANALGFIAHDPWRHWGATWISALFVHDGLGHLLSNLYFLWLYGDNVEDVLGPVPFLELFFFGGVAGHAASHLLGHPGSVYVGASGSIMALAIFYTLTFPRVRFAYFYPAAWKLSFRLTVPVYVVTAFYLALDYLGIANQARGGASVGHLSHLGGAVAGTLFWLMSERNNH